MVQLITEPDKEITKEEVRKLRRSRMNACFKNVFAGKINTPQVRVAMPLVLPLKDIDFYETE